jgi:hypothetical protein
MIQHGLALQLTTLMCFTSFDGVITWTHKLYWFSYVLLLPMTPGLTQKTETKRKLLNAGKKTSQSIEQNLAARNPRSGCCIRGQLQHSQVEPREIFSRTQRGESSL